MENAIAEKLDNFFSQYPLQNGKKGTILIQADAQPTGIFYVVEGVVRRYWITENGEEVTLNLYKPRSFLPMSWAIADVQNTHFYEAMIDVVLRKAPKDAVLNFLKKNPDVLFDLLRRVYVGMEGLWVHIASLTAGNSFGKLISSLVILVKRFGEKENSKDTVIKLSLTESDIASYAGMSRETASRELHRLRDEKLVDFQKGKIVIHNLDLLQGKISQ